MLHTECNSSSLQNAPQVEANRRKDTYRREQLLTKIEEDTVRAHEVLRQRHMLQVGIAGHTQVVVGATPVHIM